MREKLIELLWGNHNDHPSAFSGLTDEFEHEADYLMAHGVTIREKGEWVDHEPNKNHWEKSGMSFYCSSCLHNAGKYKHKVYKFCPWCGADMRGEQK